jgi:3-deoxy-D-manno-octulosonic-acid transferase
MWHLLYNLLLLIASPIILVILLSKQRCRRGLPQRLGLEDGLFGWSRSSGSLEQKVRNKLDPPNEPNNPDRPNQPVIWVHAVSLGEVVAVTPLVKELHRRHPDHRFVVSTVTETGREAVEQRLEGVAEHRYAPVDFSWVVSRTVSRLRPAVYLFVETELWPNLLRHLHRGGVQTVMVNGRLSTRSFARQQWGPVRSFYRAMLQTLTLCLMQSDRDVERIIALGADPRRVRRTGNIKFDQPTGDSFKGGLTRAALGVGETEVLFVAGSTHPGEEEALVEAYQSWVRSCPAAVLLLAPRHIERTNAVEAMVRARGLSVRRRTAIVQAPEATFAGPRVIILDSRGELASLYREADVTFVGGTLVPIGGHNLLEPAQWAKPVLFGPYTDHCVEIAEMLIQAGGGRRVQHAEDLSRVLMDLFERPDERARLGQSARAVVLQNQGALQRTVDAIDMLLAPDQNVSESPLAGHPLPLMAGQ